MCKRVVESPFCLHVSPAIIHISKLKCDDWKKEGWKKCKVCHKCYETVFSVACIRWKSDFDLNNNNE